MSSLIRASVVAWLVVSWGAAAGAQQQAHDRGPPHAMTAVDASLLRGVSDPRLSPDGRWVAYVRTIVDYAADRSTSEIVLVDVATGVTRHAFSGGSPQWSPDGHAVAFRDSRDAHSGIWIYDLATDRSRFLVPVSATDAWLGSGTVKNFAWAPDGSAIAYVGTDSIAPPEPLPNGDAAAAADVQVYSRVMYKTRTGFSDNRRTHLYVVPITCGGTAMCAPRVLTPGSFDEHSLDWSPDGRRIAFVSDRSSDPDNNYANDLWTVEVATGQTTRLTDTPSAEFAPVWSPDGSQIAFPAWRRPHNTKDSPAEDTHAWVMPAAGGAPRPIAASLDRRVTQVSWSPVGATVYFTAGDHGSVSIYRANVTGGPAQRLTTCACQSQQYSLDRAARSMAYVQNDLTHPPEVWIASVDGRRARQLTHDQDSLLARVAPVAAESFEFASFDGTRVQAWLITPSGARPGQRYPLILSIHGGPHGAFGNTFTATNQLLAGHGYGVLSINPRGSNGYGQAFSDGSVRNWGGADYQDLMAGLDTAIQRNAWIDTTRLGVTGGSYGGFMTDWIITQTPRFRAAVSLFSVSNLVSFYGTSLYTDLIEAEFNGRPWDNYPLLWQWSPLAHVANARTPTLFLHGEVDHDVPITQSEEMYVALRKLGVAATLVRYPGEGHGFHRPAHILDSVLRTEAWFDHYLGGGAGTRAAGGSGQ
jgi:dipeptidyl aminopeptidase/acylaminoacyl peptidase